MKKIKLVSFLVLSLALSAALPALVAGQSAPPAGGNGTGSQGTGGKSTPVPTSTPTPVVGDDGCDGDLEGCLGGFYFLYDWGGRHHHHSSKFGDRGSCGRD